jgi:Glucose / Sorbosone dehydrogenase
VAESTRPTSSRVPRPAGSRPIGPPQVRLVVTAGLLVALIAGVAMMVDRRGSDPTIDAGNSSTAPRTEGGSPSSSRAPAATTSSTPSGGPTTVAAAAHPLPAKSTFENQAIRLEPTISISLLTGMTWSSADGAYYAISQDGLVHRVDEGLTASEVVLDLTGEVTPFERFSERGLLGIAFDPRDGRLFLHFNDRDNNSHVVSYAMSVGKPDPATRREVLAVEQPGLGHKGGQLAFDADGNLLIAFGDGGGSRGRDAQDMTKLLGAIVRITPKLDAEGYDIPRDNPYATSDSVRPEIFAKGLRNPWRFSIDAPTGDIWIGDVGEATFEEVDRIPVGTSGQNFGWYFKEGNSDYSDGGPDGLTGPLFEYRHDEYGPAVIGGFVYHGSAIPALQGAYLFADMSGPMFALGADNETARLNVADQTNGVITSFVVTPGQELLVITQNEAIYRVLPV